MRTTVWRERRSFLARSAALTKLWKRANEKNKTLCGVTNNMFHAMHNCAQVQVHERACYNSPCTRRAALLNAHPQYYYPTNHYYCTTYDE
jgi:hypothetical protein